MEFILNSLWAGVAVRILILTFLAGMYFGYKKTIDDLVSGSPVYRNGYRWNLTMDTGRHKGIEQ